MVDALPCMRAFNVSYDVPLVQKHCMSAEASANCGAQEPTEPQVAADPKDEPGSDEELTGRPLSQPRRLSSADPNKRAINVTYDGKTQKFRLRPSKHTGPS